MIENNLAVIVLAAGMGTRMKSDRPKVMHKIAGRPMVNHLIDTAHRLNPKLVLAVIGPDMDELAAAVSPHRAVVQQDRLGTGHAVAQARRALQGFDGDVLVLLGDCPLVEAETLQRLVEARRAATDPAVVVLGFRPEDPRQYGRMVTAGDALTAIVEYKDASAAERQIALCNSGVMAFDGKRIWDLIDALGNDNAAGEYYLTDCVALARAKGWATGWTEGTEAELHGINSRVELAQAEKMVQDRLRRRAMLAGATLTDPDSVFFCWDTRTGRDVIIGPNVVFGPGVAIEDDAEIIAFSHITGAHIEAGATVGPFARLRPGAEIGPNAHIGNFVEVKKARIEDGAKVNHLSYIGDARVGARANVGAGTITCNYDGFNKSFTDIGENAFIGSNSSLVAPVKIGDGAVIGAGSVITKDVSAGALAVSRASQMELPGWAEKFREKKRAEKAAKEKKEA